MHYELQRTYSLVVAARQIVICISVLQVSGNLPLIVSIFVVSYPCVQTGLVRIEFASVYRVISRVVDSRATAG